MTGASALFCGRRTPRSRTSSDAPTFDASSNNAVAGVHVRRRERTDQQQRHNPRHHVDGHGDSSRRSYLVSRHCSLSSLAGGCVSLGGGGASASESPSGSVINPVAINNSYGGNSRLPRAVLLAKERLLHRLGVSASAARQGREVSSGTWNDGVWLVDAGDWETSISTENLSRSSLWIESPPRSNALPSMQESRRKPLGLTMEAFASLHQETFTQVEGCDEQEHRESWDDCSICLERFVEGNRLIDLPCHHRFHSSCLYPWIQACGECPYCRTAIGPSNYLPV